MSEKSVRARGRPKTLQRQQVIDVAMESYWTNGPGTVSINEICKRAAVSKPGLYREFGNEDGLQQSVLNSYCDMALTPLYELLSIDQPFQDSIAAVTALFLSARGRFPSPRGCLLREMAQSSDHLGAQTQTTIGTQQQKAHGVYRAWIERAVARGDITTGITPDVAAVYADLQFGNAMSLIKQNAPDDVVKQVMQMGFLAFGK